MALLLHYLASFGNAIGREPTTRSRPLRHYANLFLVTRRAHLASRKGTAADRVRGVFEIADPDWACGRVHGGLSSGEGCSIPIRDPVYAMRKGVGGLIDPGVEPYTSACCIDEREFFQALAVMKREGNILSRWCATPGIAARSSAP